MATITAINAASFAGDKFVNIVFSNNAQILARTIFVDSSMYIVYVNGKLVQIMKQGFACKVLATGVSIR